MQANGQVPSVEVSAVENVMLWKDPWLTAKVFSLGFYIIICLRQLVSGARLLQALTRQLPDMKHVAFQPEASASWLAYLSIHVHLLGLSSHALWQQKAGLISQTHAKKDMKNCRKQSKG